MANLDVESNEEVVALAEWLRSHNDNLPQDKKVGFAVWMFMMSGSLKK